MASNGLDTASEPPVVFRGKKRKIYRQRVESRDTVGDDAEHATNDAVIIGADGTKQEPTASDAEDEGLSVAEALRLRNARRTKLGGVAFSAVRKSKRDDEGPTEGETEQSLVLRDDAPDLSRATDGFGMSRRFAPQTGLVGELVNKHMEEYVESELARRNRLAADSSENTAQNPHQGAPGPFRGGHAPPPPGEPPKAQPQPTMQGKLQEIDLGEEARARNIAMTERARRRLEGRPVEDDEETTGRPKKVRLGRDGKPWRGRNRRGSDDIKRDQLVEQFLSENRLDVYEAQPDHQGASGDGDDEDGGADDRIAEEFRREFMDAMSQRQQRKKPAANAPKVAVKPGEEVLKGPKLGGSRNLRAQMRDILLKEQERKR